MDFSTLAHPLSLVGFVLALVFGASSRMRRAPRWWPKAAIALASVALLGGLGLAYVREKPNEPVGTAPGGPLPREASPPGTASAGPSGPITTYGPNSPVIQGSRIEGGVRIGDK